MSKLKVVAEPGTHTIVMTREFDAPRELVFKAYTDPALVARWWGPEALTTIIEKLDAKAGGIWRYVHRLEDGSDAGHSGVYHEVTAPERLIYTYEFEPMAGHVGLITTTFEEKDGKTLLTELNVFPSIEDRDGIIATGMEGGAAESFDRLETLVKTL